MYEAIMGVISGHFKNCNNITAQGRDLKFSEVSLYGIAWSHFLGIIVIRGFISTFYWLE